MNNNNFNNNLNGNNINNNNYKLIYFLTMKNSHFKIYKN